MAEKDVEKKVVRWARNHNWISWKFTSPGNNGVPDRIFVSPKGVVCFIEFKAPGKLPTGLQVQFLVKLNQRNVPAQWFDNAEVAISWLEGLDARTMEP